MPKKRPVTKNSSSHLKKVVHDGFSSLLTVRSILAGHFKQSDKAMRKIERFVEDYSEFQKECEIVSKRAGI